MTLFIDIRGMTLHRGDGARFESHCLRWVPGTLPEGAQAATLQEGVRWLQRRSGTPVRVPVGVLGPENPTREQLDTARQVGRCLAEMGLVVLCGGRQGVAGAACEGAAQAGGVSVGLLAEDDWGAAAPHASVVLSTGLGGARAAVIARAALCLTAVGGGLATLVEIATAVQYRRPVFAFPGSPDVPGSVRVRDTADLCQRVCAAVLGL